MPLEEKIQHCITKIEEVKLLLKIKKDFKELKARMYELLAIFSEIYEQTNIENPNLARLIEWPLSQEINSYFQKEISPLTEKEVNSNKEIYFPLFEDDLIPRLEIMKKAYTKLKEVISEAKIEIFYDSKYIKEKKDFPAQQALINKVENEIIQYLKKGGKLRKNTLTITDRTNIKLLHAHVPAPLDDYRIQYLYEKEKKQITFLRFARGKDLGYSNH
ncbi:MAG: hypothetical protein Q8R18_00560 [bacterium]|nr:hypothetical protein [bacterium]